MTEDVGLLGGDQLDLHAAPDRPGRAWVKRRSPRYAISMVSEVVAASMRPSRWLSIGQVFRPVVLPAVDQEVDAARRVELVVAGHANSAGAGRGPAPSTATMTLNPLVAVVVVADAHRAQGQVVVVDDEHLGVIEPLLGVGRP